MHQGMPIQQEMFCMQNRDRKYQGVLWCFINACSYEGGYSDSDRKSRKCLCFMMGRTVKLIIGLACKDSH